MLKRTTGTVKKTKKTFAKNFEDQPTKSVEFNYNIKSH